MVLLVNGVSESVKVLAVGERVVGRGEAGDSLYDARGIERGTAGTVSQGAPPGRRRKSIGGVGVVEVRRRRIFMLGRGCS